MANLRNHNQDVVWISVPLDSETVERLANLSDICHADPVKVAASLLHDVLKDDEQANLPVARAVGDTPIH